ncbi:hypothetical protein T492DRAFT_1097195, partial [Pavlovales sp. CCMP2436]|mmetsp:Transcript_46410/g.107107  ORF Transcript_46410/g.107107 Transcript_46410/m.107107 type:complete len:124 (-) Transcript_46410:135-506(-)
MADLARMTLGSRSQGLGARALLRRCTTDAAAYASIKERASQQPPTLRLFRDVMRLTFHIAARSAKGDAMRTIARTEFRKHAGVEDEAKIVELKDTAIRAISNYVVYAHSNVYKDAAKNPKGTL